MRTCRFFFIELLRNEVFVFVIYGNINRIEYSVFRAFSFFFFFSFEDDCVILHIYIQDINIL